MKWDGKVCLALATVAALFGAAGAPSAKAQGQSPNVSQPAFGQPDEFYAALKS
jgi:hypothetical protein